MSQLVQGTVCIELPAEIVFPADAGSLSDQAMRELFPARYGIGQVCRSTADAMRKDPMRLAIAHVTADGLQSMGMQAEEIKQVITDVETIHGRLLQASRLLANTAHTELRKVLAGVRGLEKFDPQLTELVPALIDYFANSKPADTTTAAKTSAATSAAAKGAADKATIEKTATAKQGPGRAVADGAAAQEPGGDTPVSSSPAAIA